MTTPRVSVVMPVYNTEEYVAESVESVLAQTFEDFEFIIIDDGSTDGSRAVLEKLAQRDSRIRLFSRPNTGYGPALNEAAGYARGALLARLDSDDTVDPALLERQVACFDADPALVLLGTNAVVMDENSQVFGDFAVPTEHDTLDAALLAGRSCIHHPGSMMRLSALRQVGGYRTQFVPCEDYDLWLRLAEVGRVGNLPDAMMQKRMLPGSAIVSGIGERDRLVERILDDALERRGLPARAEPIHSQIRSRADYYNQWAWMALKRSQRPQARRYARKAVCAAPFSAENWKLLACVLRGH